MVEDAEALDEQADLRSRRRRRVRRLGGGVALVALLAMGGLWLARKPIADSFIARELAARGVQGRYLVTRIGPRTQRLDNLVIGDPRAPDLVVRFVEVDVGWGLTGARITRVRAAGVRLRGRLQNGVLDLGQVNRLIEGSGGKAELPEWVVEVDDARADIASDYGQLVFGLQGRGALQSGFGGTLSLASPSLRFGDCRTGRLIAPFDVATDAGRFVLKGPISVPDVQCTESHLALAAPKLDVNMRIDPALEDLSGAVSLYADEVEQGERRAERLSGLVTFAGKAEELRGSASLAAVRSSFDGIETDGVKIGGNFAVSPGARDRALAWQGVATIDNGRASGQLDRAGMVRAVAGTPFEPLAARLSQAIGEIGKASRLTLGGEVNMIGDRGNAALKEIGLRAQSGATVVTAAGSAIRYNWPEGAVSGTGTLTLNGGGLPEGTVSLATDADGGVSGTARFAEYRAGRARLSLTPVQFGRNRVGQWQVRTTMTLDGPLPDGRVSGLTVPLDARLSSDGAVELAGDCAPVRWQVLRLSSLSLDPAALRLCGISDGQMRLAAARLTGTIGDSPIAVTADATRYRLADGRFDLARPDVRIGQDESPVWLAADRLTGVVRGSSGLAGTIEGGRGRIGAVPLDLTNIAGRWTFVDGRLDVHGALRVSDTQADARFNPLTAQDVHLQLANNRIEAKGALVHPVRKAQVASVVIRHDLASAKGQADISLDSLRFGGLLQPDDLTPMALGVVANVDGVVEGQGRIRWNGTTVTSDGTFSTRDMSFAAAFGPVSGFATTLRFADLLGLRTEPGQVLTVESVNPGIEVRDGEIRYALRSVEQAVIEGGRWPFSGGTLELLPATLDLDARKPRNLTFRVVGLDAGSFINALELENISATGTFDGLLPMIFDAQGGRIEGGILVARQQGNPPLILTSASSFNVPCDPARQSGNLAYVGEVSNAQLGAYGKLAFDALKNLRYRCLTILLDGALDGEFVTQVRINGVNQGTKEARNSAIARPFLGLPFIFNVRIEAPFRGLLNTAAGFADPGVLIRNHLGEQFAPASGAGNRSLAVQPADSDKAIEGDRE